MHPDDDPDAITNSKTSHHDDNDGTTNRLEKILQGISIETIEAEAIMYLAIYYHENNDFDNAAMYVWIISNMYFVCLKSQLFLFVLLQILIC